MMSVISGEGPEKVSQRHLTAEEWAQHRSAQQRKYRSQRKQRAQEMEAALQQTRAELDSLRCEQQKLQADNLALEQLVAYASGMAAAMGDAAAAAVHSAVSASAAALHCTKSHFELFSSWLRAPSIDEIQVWLRAQGGSKAELEAAMASASADFVSRLAAEVREWQLYPQSRGAIEAKVEIWMKTRTRVGAALVAEYPVDAALWIRSRLLPPEADGRPNARLRPLVADLALTAEQRSVLERAWRTYQEWVGIARRDARHAVALAGVHAEAAAVELGSEAAGMWLGTAGQASALAAYPEHQIRAIFELMSTWCSLVAPRQRMQVCLALGPLMLDVPQLCTVLFEEGGGSGRCSSWIVV